MTGLTALLNRRWSRGFVTGLAALLNQRSGLAALLNERWGNDGPEPAFI